MVICYMVAGGKKWKIKRLIMKNLKIFLKQINLLEFEIIMD